jgi:hypothetical protein
MVSDRKKELDRIRTEWRKKHRILSGKVILWPDKPPEHINARASKLYNWFWKNILLELDQHDIPAIISNLKQQVSAENDSKKIQMFRTMIGMAEDAYQLKNLEDIMNFDTDIRYEKKPVYNSETGIIDKDGKSFTVDYAEDESEIIIRDLEGVIIDKFSIEDNRKESIVTVKNNAYKNWNYMKEK